MQLQKVIERISPSYKKYFSKKIFLMKLYAYIKGWRTVTYYSDCLRKSNHYSVFLPNNGISLKKAIIALHGSKGSIYEYVPTLLSKYAESENLIIVCPDSAGYKFFESEGEQIVLEVLKHIKNYFSVNENNVYILGNSMGGRGAGFIGLRNSQLFAGIVCIYGTITESDYDLLKKAVKKIPIFIAHGTEDKIIPLSESEALIKMLSRLSFQYSFKIIDGLGHDLKVFDLSLPSIIHFLKSLSKS